MSPALSEIERLRATERVISFIRLGVIVFNSILYLTIAPARDRHGLAVAIIVISGAYALLTLFWDPEQLNPRVVPVATMVADNVLIAIWLHATGGFDSPFFMLFYAEAAASVGRFGWVIGTWSAAGSALLYVGVVLMDDRAPLYDVLARIGYIFFIAAFVAYVVEAARKLERDTATAEATVDAYADLARLKAAFVATISHELRTPLTTIKGATSTLLRNEDRFDPDQSRTLLEMVERQSEHLGKMVQDLIDVADLERGAMQLVFESCDLRKVLGGEIDRVATLAKRDIDATFPQTVEPIRCDHVLIRRAFHNLLDNAVKFAPEGAITVHVTQDHRCTFIDVIDQGIGVDASQHERIFERFHQVDSSLTRSVQGSGIGLNIARELVRLHRGDIEVHSEIGKGARFRMTLPKDPSGIEAAPKARRSA